jgi:hypothetical protein
LILDDPSAHAEVCQLGMQEGMTDKTPPPVRMDMGKARECLTRRGRGAWDILLMCSGGKDSCFLAETFAQAGDLCILLCSCKPGFISSEAMENLDYVVRQLHCEHILYRLMRGIYYVSLTDKTKRWYAGGTCTSCCEVIRASALGPACHLQIPYIVTGHDPSQYCGQHGVIRRAETTGFIGLRQEMLDRLSPEVRQSLRDCHHDVRWAKLKSLLLPWQRLPEQAAVLSMTG